MLPSKRLHTDVVVIGSGAGGLTAAITCKLLGLNAIVLEKDRVFGGTTAWSGGVAWIPGNMHAERAGIADSPALAEAYIRAQCGDAYDEKRVASFLENGKEMNALLDGSTEVRFQLAKEPDYHQDLHGALVHGRALQPLDFSGQTLGELFPSLRKPPRQRVLFWGLQIGGAHVSHFINATRSFRSFKFVLSRMLGHLIELARFGENRRLAMGNALAARLGHSARNLGIEILTSTPAEELILENGVTGVIARDALGGRISIRSARGVVLACGGFSHDYDRRRELYRHHPDRDQHLSNAPDSISGDGIRLGESAGGAVVNFRNAAVWYPTSRVEYPDGTAGHNAHLLERGKPGFIAVNRGGRRFANEASNYHDFVQAMMRDAENEGVNDGDIVAFMICDHRAFRRYGLGAVKPWPMPYRGFLKTGYLKRGSTIGALAVELGIDPQILDSTVAAFNSDASGGRDPAFRKGESAYDRNQGDPGQQPNPCLTPLAKAPFYGVTIRPGDLSTLSGLRTDEHARILNENGVAIAGLYAVGNDQASVFSGSYPGGGSTIGPAMTFGYVAAKHLASREPS